MGSSSKGELERLSSESLALQAMSGCEASFSALLHRHRGPLAGFLRRRGASAHDAEDITQEAFIKAYNGLQSFNPKYRFSTWLFAIAKNLAARWRASMNGISLANLPEQSHPSVESPSESFQKSEESEGIWRTAKECLPEAQMETLWLRYAENLSVAQISIMTGRSQSSVKVMLHRARLKMAEKLKSSQGEE